MLSEQLAAMEMEANARERQNFIDGSVLTLSEGAVGQMSVERRRSSLVDAEFDSIPEELYVKEEPEHLGSGGTGEWLGKSHRLSPCYVMNAPNSTDLLSDPQANSKITNIEEVIAAAFGHDQHGQSPDQHEEEGTRMEGVMLETVIPYNFDALKDSIVMEIPRGYGKMTGKTMEIQCERFKPGAAVAIPVPRYSSQEDEEDESTTNGVRDEEESMFTSVCVRQHSDLSLAAAEGTKTGGGVSRGNSVQGGNFAVGVGVTGLHTLHTIRYT